MGFIHPIERNLTMDGHITSDARTRKTPVVPLITNDPAAVTAALAAQNEDARQYVDELKSILRFLDRKLEFSVNTDLGSVTVKIIDPSTDKVIKEIPSADIQKLKLRLREAAGILLDEVV